MKYFYERLCISILLGMFLDVKLIGGEPTLQPTSVYSCPNEIVDFTCWDSQVHVLEWIVEPYIPEVDGLVYAAQLDTESSSMNRSDIFFSKVINISRRTQAVADLTISIRIKTSGVDNVTVVKCRSLLDRQEFEATSTIYIAGFTVYLSCTNNIVS